MSVKASPWRGRYLSQNPLLWRTLAALDAVVDPFAKANVQRPLSQIEPPKRLLVAFGGHLGDAVIGSAVFPLIKSHWPDCQIGILTGSWARDVIGDHPAVSWVHVMDHWFLNRAVHAPHRRLLRYFGTRRRALREIAGIGYDMAIDFYPYFANNIRVYWQARIPVRIGYSSGGLGALLTHRLDGPAQDRHVTENHADLLRAAGMALPDNLKLNYAIRFAPASAEPIRESGGLPDEYIVLHMGAGSLVKEWPREKWRKLADNLLDAGKTLVFTGRGEAQKAAADWVIAGRPRCHNLCDHQDWEEFASAIAMARLLVTVDSVAGHIAAAAGTPVIVLMTGINCIAQWLPLGVDSSHLTNEVPCSPCFQSNGCDSMKCLRDLEVERVLLEVQGKLNSSAATTIARA